MIGLFTEPALLENEDAALYWNMVSAMIDEESPKTTFDWSDLHEYVTKLWDERVLRRATDAIIRGGRHQAVLQFLAEIIPGDMKAKHIGETATRASRFFSAGGDGKNVRLQLARYGITEAEQLARSAQNNSDAIMMFEGMMQSRQRSRRKLQKEMKRRRSSQEVEQRSRANASAHLEMRGSSQEVCPVPGREAHKRDQSQQGDPQDVTLRSTMNNDPAQIIGSRSSQDPQTSHRLDSGPHRKLDARGSCQEARAKAASEPTAHQHGN